MTLARPSWPPSDEEIERLVAETSGSDYPLPPSAMLYPWEYLTKFARAVLAKWGAPPAPEVASEEARSLVEELIGVIEGLADQQAMQDDFYREPLSRAKATLAKWGAARKEEKP